jgi:hypothetical protein
VPVVLFYGRKDWIVNEKDLDYLKQNLPNIVFEYSVDQFGHMDFVLGKNAKEMVYDKIIELLF